MGIHARAVLLTLIAGILATGVEAQQSLAGNWEGALTREGSVQSIRMRFGRGPDGPEATVDIPELALHREPVDSLEVEHDRLSFRILYGQFELRLHRDIQEMTGSNGWDPPLRIHLKKMFRSSVPRLDSVRFAGAAGTLAGTFIAPPGPGPHPAAVVVHGAGPRDRSRWTYRGRGDALAALGVAALVFDQRGLGASEGESETASFEDLAADVRAAVEYIASRPDVDPDRIGLQGASQGGWIGLMAASHPRVSYLILQGTPATTVWEAEEDWVEGHMVADGFPAPAVDSALTHTRRMFDMVRSEEGLDEFVQASRRVAGGEWAEYVYVPSSRKEARALIRDWKRERYDPAPVLRDLSLPALFIYGELDRTAPPSKNVRRLQRIIREEELGDRLQVRILKGAKHNLERPAELRGGAYAWPDSFYVFPRKAPGYLVTVARWLTSVGVLWSNR